MTDACAPHDASWAENTVRFTQAGETVFPFHKVVERAQQQYCIRSCAGMRQVASISDFCGRQRTLRLAGGCCPRLFDMFRHGIEQVHLISVGSEPASIRSGASSGVDDIGRSGRQVAENQFLRADLFELKPSSAETRGFVGVAVVTNNLLNGIVDTHKAYRSFEFALVSPRPKRIQVLDEAVHNPLQLSKLLAVAAQLRDRIELIEKQDTRSLSSKIEKSANVFRRASEERRNQAIEARDVQVKAQLLGDVKIGRAH